MSQVFGKFIFYYYYMIFHSTRSSSIIPRNAIELTRFISSPTINNDRSFHGMFSFRRALWKSAHLVLSLLSESLLELNHAKTFFSSELTV